MPAHTYTFHLIILTLEIAKDYIFIICMVLQPNCVIIILIILPKNLLNLVQIPSCIHFSNTATPLLAVVWD